MPRLPGWLKRLSVPRERFRRVVLRTEPLLRRCERWLRPRPSGLTRGSASGSSALRSWR